MRALMIFVLMALFLKQENGHLRAQRKLRQELYRTSQELATTQQKLHLATQTLPDSERRSYIKYTVLMALVPFVFLWLNDGAKSPFVVIMCGILGTITYMINLSAPYRDELVANKTLASVRIIAKRTPWWQWVMAGLTGIFYAAGAWKLGDPINLAGLCGSMALLTLPAILNRKQT